MRKISGCFLVALMLFCPSVRADDWDPFINLEKAPLALDTNAALYPSQDSFEDWPQEDNEWQNDDEWQETVRDWRSDPGRIDPSTLPAGH